MRLFINYQGGALTEIQALQSGQQRNSIQIENVPQRCSDNLNTHLDAGQSVEDS